MISKQMIAAMDECMEFGALNNVEPLNDFLLRALYEPQPEPVMPTEPFSMLEVEDHTTVPIVCLVMWVAFIAFCAWVDAGMPTAFPL